MANTPKRKRLEKTTTESSMVVSQQKFYCCRCGRAYSRQKGFFPVSHSPMYRGSGFLPMCCDCVDDMFAEYLIRFADRREAVRRMCMKLDLYWNESLYKMTEQAASGANSFIRAYIGKSNIVRYLDKNYDDTIMDDEKLAKQALLEKQNAESPDDGGERRDGGENNSSPDTPDTTADASGVEEDGAVTIPEEYIDFWGKGFALDFYEELEHRYRDWTGGAAVTEPNERSLYKQICLLETTITRDSAQGKAIDKNVNALNNLLGSMNLKPAQKKEDSSSNLDNTPLGVWTKRWEDKRPLPEVDPEFRDVDGIVRYVDIWFRGHLAKMLGIKNGYSRMYEEEIAKRRVAYPEYDDEDDEEFFNDVFDTDGKPDGSGDSS